MKRIIGKIFSAATVPVVVLGLAAVTYLLVFAPQRRPAGKIEIKDRVAEEKKKEKEDNDPGLTNINVEKPEISHLVDGQVVWTVSADSVKSDVKSGVTKLYNSNGLFVRKGDSGLEFSGPLAIYNSKTKSVRVEGEVKGKLVPEDSSLTAGSISWEEKSGKIVADKVRLAVGEATAAGGRMELNQKDKKVTLSGGVRIEAPFARPRRKVK